MAVLRHVRVIHMSNYCDEYVVFLSVCLSVCALASLENHLSEFYHFLHVHVAYGGVAMYFQFCERCHVTA